MTIDAVIFDFGGTLDTGGDHWYAVMADAYRARGLELTREAYIAGERAAAREVRSDMGLAATLAVKVKAQGCADTDAIVGALVSRVRRCTAESARLLATLSARIPLALVSNYYGNLDRVIGELGLHRYFAVTVDSALVGIRKPDPAIFGLALERLGVVPGRAVVVGDSVNADILPAASLGCGTALITGRPWPWAEPTRTPATRYAGTLAEIVAALLADINK